jgi:uncharacterized protein YndB with AHSA1/START domain
MPSIEERVTIAAPASKVFEALVSPEGLHGWWSLNSDIMTKPGDISELRFDKDGRLVRMCFRIDTLDAPRRVAWTCIANDAPPWVGTTLRWDLQENQSGAVGGGSPATDVTLTHAGWQGTGPWFQDVVDGWKHFMSSLKRYVETGTGQPWG